MKPCSVCGDPNYLDTDAHPCCEFWQRIRPGRPCGGCAASREHWRKQRGKPAPATLGYEPVDDGYGYTCGTCGLSDRGAERLRSLGFPARGCVHCRDHFAILRANGAPTHMTTKRKERP